MHRPARVLSAALVLVLGALTGIAHADGTEPRPADARPADTRVANARVADARPADAPRLALDRLVVPPLPLEYQVQERAGIKLAYHPSTGERARLLEATIAGIRAELGVELGRDVLASVEIRIAPSPGEVVRLAPIERLGAYVGALSFRDAQLVVVSAPSSRSADAPALEGLLRHALAHLALDEALADRQIPSFLHEGYATHFAGEDRASRFESLTRAALGGHLLATSAIDASYPEGPPEGTVAHAEGADFARFLAEPAGRSRFPALLGAVRGGGAFDTALRDAYGEDRAAIEQRFRKEMAKRYGFAPVLAGATLAWVAAAVWIAARRRAKRKELAAEQRARASAERRLARPKVERAPRRRPAQLDDEGTSEPVAREPEVPKIEHDGSWHTLH